MSKGFISGQHKPDEKLAPGNRAFSGAPIGILVAEASYVMLPGNVANACTYPFPVIYKTLEGVPFERVLAGDPAVAEAVIEGGQILVDSGVRAVVGACGSFANYQRAAAAALNVPVFLSSMLQVPWVLTSLKKEQKLLVLSAVASALTDKVFDQCGISQPERMLIEQAIDVPEFEAMLSPEGFNPAKLESSLAAHVRDLVARHPEAGAILLQCSDLPPFARAIQNATGLPVFDMNTLISWVHAAVVRRTYDGII